MHGIPDGYRLRDGDLVSIDCGAQPGGRAGDSAIGFTVGVPRPADVTLIETAERALAAGHRGGRRRQPHRRRHARDRHGVPRRGYGTMEDLDGHGIGRSMHEDPGAPNEGRPGRDMPLRHGMVFAIGPMPIEGGTDTYHAAPDGWTLRTDDGTRAAHVEHTAAITETGPRILTARRAP
ncbi:M24 family metallopeptidase [Streptomyces sp. PU_AKi4]|uniref:M24 family metallopeptidase n=1 Tax=Streptomyces sp. PU_AKi4 TaxID=2800809 RepID=UPI003523FE67